LRPIISADTRRLARRTVSTCIGRLENRAELFRSWEFEEETTGDKLVMFGVGGLLSNDSPAGDRNHYLLSPRLSVNAAFGWVLISQEPGAGLAVKNLLKQGSVLRNH